MRIHVHMKGLMLQGLTTLQWQITSPNAVSKGTPSLSMCDLKKASDQVHFPA